MNSIVNEGFFADVVVVVEGLSDVGVLWKLQEIRNKKWVERGIVIIPANGKNNIDRPTIVFRGLLIPTYFIFDGDVKYADNNSKNKNVIDQNHRLLRLANSKVEDFPETQIHDTWAVFKEELEEEIVKGISKEEYIKYRDQVADELGYDKPTDVGKNIEGSARLIEVIYENTAGVPILDEIIEKITKLSSS
jgi:putative ATP-dependent endonuclease of OLD family